jgi:hypothetical protein
MQYFVLYTPLSLQHCHMLVFHSFRVLLLDDIIRINATGNTAFLALVLVSGCGAPKAFLIQWHIRGI